MKVALAQINPTIGAFEHNSAKMLHFCETAKKQGADMVIFPDLSLVGYPPLDLLDKDHFVTDNLSSLKKLAAQIRGITAVVGYVDKNAGVGKPYFNSAAVITNSKISSTHHKTLLPSYDVFDETRHFEPAPRLKLAHLDRTAWALTICEDIWNDKAYWHRRLYARDPLPPLFKKHPAFLVNMSASPFSVGKQKTRQNLLRSIARKNQVPTLFVNQVGANDALIFDGGSFVMNTEGNIIGLWQTIKN